VTLLRTNFPRVTGRAKPGKGRRAMPGRMPKGLAEYFKKQKKKKPAAKKPAAAKMKMGGAVKKPARMKAGGMVKKPKY